VHVHPQSGKKFLALFTGESSKCSHAGRERSHIFRKFLFGAEILVNTADFACVLMAPKFVNFFDGKKVHPQRKSWLRYLGVNVVVAAVVAVVVAIVVVAVAVAIILQYYYW